MENKNCLTADERAELAVSLSSKIAELEDFLLNEKQLGNSDLLGELTSRIQTCRKLYNTIAYCSDIIFFM